MTPGGLLIVFFLFTLASVSAAGYVFVLRPAREQAMEAQIPAPLVSASTIYLRRRRRCWTCSG